MLLHTDHIPIICNFAFRPGRHRSSSIFTFQLRPHLCSTRTLRATLPCPVALSRSRTRVTLQQVANFSRPRTTHPITIKKNKSFPRSVPTDDNLLFYSKARLKLSRVATTTDWPRIVVFVVVVLVVGPLSRTKLTKKERKKKNPTEKIMITTDRPTDRRPHREKS